MSEGPDTPPPPTTTRSATRRGTSRLPVVLVLVAPLLALWPVVPAEFIPLDDPANVSRNPDFNPPTLAKVTRYWTGPHLNMYAPLTYTAWAGVARLAWMDSVDERGLQLNPYVFHAANLLLHVICASLVYAILRLLLAREPLAPSARPAALQWAACVGALLFALHPMQVEPVAWVTGFRDLLAAAFSLASILAYLAYATRGGRAGLSRYLLAYALLLAALLSKPTAVVVPLVAAALDWGLLRRPLRDVAKPVGGLLLLVVPFALMAKAVQTGELTFTSPLWSRPIVAADALVFYAGKLVLPLRLGLDYGRAPEWLLHQRGCGWMWLAVIPLAVVLWVLRRHRWVLAGVAIFIASVLPVLGLTKFDFQHHSTVADRYVYLGMLGPAVLLAFTGGRGGRNSAVACGVVLVLLAVRSHLQARAWKDGETIYRATLATNPGSLLANRGLGLMAQSSNRWDEAEAYYKSALRTRPGDPVTSFNLGTLYLRTGRAMQAVEPLRVAAAGRDQPWVVTNLANALAQAGDLAEARRVLEGALANTPERERAELHATLAAVRFRQGDRIAAAEQYRAALRINPNLTIAAQELAALERSPATTRSAASTQQTR